MNSTSRCFAGALAALALQACDAPSSPSSDAAPLTSSRAALLDAPVILTPIAGLTLTTRLPVMSGTVAAGAQVALSVDGRPVCRVTADVLGLWVCVLPVSEALSNGAHVITAVASDGSGNTSAEARVQVSVLALGPSTVILTGPPARTQSSSATFTFASTALLASYQCTLDEGAPTACTPPYTVSGLTEGTHRLRVRSRDLLGLLSDTTPPESEWTVDRTPPTVTLTSTPPAVSALPVGTFTFSASEPSLFTCSVDGGLALPCVSPFVSLTLSDGTHTFSVTATDLAGNTSTAARHTWRVDTRIPDMPVITSPAVNVSVSLLEHVSGTAEPGASVRVFVDGQLEGTASVDAQGLWRLPLPVLSEGPHVLTAVTVDAAGHVSLAATVSLILDLTPPQTTIVSGPAPLVATRNATFDFDANEPGVTFLCALNGPILLPCADPLTLTVNHDGDYVMTVSARDAAGNVDLTPALHRWRVDTVAPEAPVVRSPVAGVTLGRSPADVTGTAEPGARVHLSLHGGRLGSVTADEEGAWTLSLPGTLADGLHELVAVAVDAAGNVSDSVSVVFRIESRGADTRIVSGPPLYSASMEAEFTFESELAGATFQCRTGTAPFVACGTPARLTSLSDGPWVFEVRAVAPNGQPDATPAVHAWTVDTVAPEVTVTQGPAARTYALDATFGFTANEPLVTFECGIDGQPFQACEAATTMTALSVGPHVLQVRARDAAGNTGVAVEHGWTILAPGSNEAPDGGTSGGNGDPDAGTGNPDSGTNGGNGNPGNGNPDPGTGTNGNPDSGTPGGNPNPGTGDNGNPGPGTDGDPSDGLGVLDLRGGGAGCSTTGSSGLTGSLVLLGTLQRLRRRRALRASHLSGR